MDNATAKPRVTGVIIGDSISQKFKKRKEIALQDNILP